MCTEMTVFLHDVIWVLHDQFADKGNNGEKGCVINWLGRISVEGRISQCERIMNTK